jgi:Fur family ferric uptake transcriptional regulator
MDDFAARLKAHGLRNTPQRRAVLDALGRHPHSTTAELVSLLVDGSRGELSKQGLYNTLDDLTRVGLARCIVPSGSLARYELRVGDNHHHLVCRVCGKVEDVDCATGSAPCLTPVEHGGFEVDEAEVFWWGRCADCAVADLTLTQSK